ncbi:hypothetical protein [Acidomonas methanolica]|uniref:UrcA family protein n=1 Tax=Acidomonas methanolica NBRC 104435 TaxID=1231351 RepID=A0A023D496_ACIMT|nr:hypothetical protein [Acidomonas methanolica]MBU2653235.1 hypothetical protein [Acidomonas methanolica]TCS32184.1 hypothetical protein EDC31_101121 [Acidomonas methanolica]GAJ28988.1 hypothetical protein Amme_041_022 [Acidomonas methanolica NBRC 104435]GBQ52261.1 hypothetical protein AA0498_1691 [Acidomonas methanolica]GEK97618.1 hypothetical protein AME01nite_01170 [Acidomonas methanolica NBRC 104435]
MIPRARLSILSLLFACAPSVAFADPLANCGAEPEAPPVSTKDVEHYNASVDRFQSYEKDARAYNACISAAARKEESAISDEAGARIAKIHAQSVAVQQRIADNFRKIGAALAAGAKKLEHH